MGVSAVGVKLPEELPDWADWVKAHSQEVCFQQGSNRACPVTTNLFNQRLATPSQDPGLWMLKNKKCSCAVWNKQVSHL